MSAPAKMTNRQFRRAHKRGQVVVMVDHRPWWKRRWYLRWTGRLLAAVAALVWVTSFGRRRALGWPLWAAVAAVTVQAWWPWAIAATALSLVPTVRAWAGARARIISSREAGVWAAAAGTVGALHYTSGWTGAPWWVPAGAVVPAAAAWWWGRRVRRPSRFQRDWDANVGQVKEWADVKLTDCQVRVNREGHPEGTARLVVPKGQTAEGIARDDDEIASHLSVAYPAIQAGSVAISHVRKDGIRVARLLLADPRKGAQPVYWQGPTLDPRTGMYQLGWTGHEPAMMRLFHGSGGLNTVRVAGPRSGKGQSTIVGGVESLATPLVLPIFIDGKRGAGIRSLAAPGVLYARTPGQWIVAWEAAMKMMRLRAEEYGERGKTIFNPTVTEPVILVDVDEWRYVHKAWPQMIEDAVWWSGQAPSYGGDLNVNLHKGDGPGYGDTEFRSNSYSNGQVWIGPQGDMTAENVAVQSWGVNPRKLPSFSGWGYICTTSNGEVSGTVMARTLFIPGRSEVEEKGCPAPFGTVEDWHSEIQWPSLPARMQAIYDEARELIESGRADNDPKATEEARERAKGPQSQTVDHLILAVLRGHPEGALPGEIEKATGRNRQHIQDRLAALVESGRVTQDGPRKPYRLTGEPAVHELETAS